MPQPTDTPFLLAADADFACYATFYHLDETTGKRIKTTDGSAQVYLTADPRSLSEAIQGTATYFGGEGAVKKWVCRWESTDLPYDTVHPLYNENGAWLVAIHENGSRDVQPVAYVDDRRAALA